MKIYLLKRIFALIPVLFGVVFLVSILIRFVPGDPVDVLMGSYATEIEKNEVRNNLGLNQNWIQQFINYSQNILRGDFGKSFIYGTPVLAMILERLPATMILALTSIFVAILISFPLGILAGFYSGKWIDFLCSTVSLFGVAIPGFWLGPLLMSLFALKLNLLPVSGSGTIAHLFLPSMTMGFSLSGILARMIRTNILEQKREDYVRTFRSLGVSEFKILTKHVLRNSLLPVITLLGLQFGVLLTGAIITERIFNWPGLGSLILEGIGNRDFPVVQGCVLVFSFTYVLVNLLTDILYSIVDPRIRLSKKVSKR